MSAVNLGGLLEMLKSASAAGIPDSEQATGMVSSLWMSMCLVGGCGGSTVGSLVYDQLGFQDGMLVGSLVMGTTLALLGLYIVINWAINNKAKS